MEQMNARETGNQIGSGSDAKEQSEVSQRPVVDAGSLAEADCSSRFSHRTSLHLRSKPSKIPSSEAAECCRRSITRSAPDERIAPTQRCAELLLGQSDRISCNFSSSDARVNGFWRNSSGPPAAS